MSRPASKEFLAALRKGRGRGAVDARKPSRKAKLYKPGYGLKHKAAPRTKHYDEADFRRDPQTCLYCWACQKDLNPRKPYREVFLVDGDEILHPDDVGRAGELHGVLAWLPCGPDCAKKIGLEWSRPHATVTR